MRQRVATKPGAPSHWSVQWEYSLLPCAIGSPVPPSLVECDAPMVSPRVVSRAVSKRAPYVLQVAVRGYRVNWSCFRKNQRSDPSRFHLLISLATFDRVSGRHSIR
eukprot:9024937-Pyramimonas_sp.AAC.1